MHFMSSSAVVSAICLVIVDHVVAVKLHAPSAALKTNNREEGPAPAIVYGSLLKNDANNVQLFNTVLDSWGAGPHTAGHLFAVGDASFNEYFVESGDWMVPAPCGTTANSQYACKEAFLIEEALKRNADWLVLFDPDVSLVPANMEQYLTYLSRKHIGSLTTAVSTRQGEGFVCKHKATDYEHHIENETCVSGSPERQRGLRPVGSARISLYRCFTEGCCLWSEL